MTTNVHIINAGPGNVEVYACRRIPNSNVAKLPGDFSVSADGQPDPSFKPVQLVPGQLTTLCVHDMRDIRITELPE